MKLNNLAIRGKCVGLYAVLALMLASCQSDEQKLAQLDSEIENLKTQIDSMYVRNEFTDSIARNKTIQAMGRRIENDTPHVDSLRDRNYILVDSINMRNIARASGKYPLSKFLSKEDLKIIQNQLREYHSEWNAKYAKNIIMGRGTLLDLYKTCFDLDYSLFEPPFHIIDDLGSVRFDDRRLDALCEQFENEKIALESQESANILRCRENQKEFAENERQIKDYERRCAVHDSLYMDIENYFKPQITKRLDSLKNRCDSLRIVRVDLAQTIASRHR